MSNENTAVYSNNAPGYESNFRGAVERVRQKIIYALTVYGHTLVFMCVAIPFAFIANYVVAKGEVQDDASFVAELEMLTMAITSAFFGIYQIQMSTKKLFWTGILYFGVTRMLFRVLKYAPSAANAATFNIVQVISNGAYVIVALTIICQGFPYNAVTAFGIAETFASVGYTCGPLVVGFLFSISEGLLFSFVTSIVLPLPIFLVGFCYSKNYGVSSYDDDNNIRTIDLVKLLPCLQILGMATSVLGIILMSHALSSVYLTHSRISIVEVGSVLVLLSACCAVSSFLAAFICDIGNKSRRAVMLVGYLGMYGIPFALTPTQMTAKGYASLAAFGSCSGFALISSFSELMHGAVGDQIEQRASFALHSTLSGLWNFAYGIGAFTFPVIGVSLLRATHFELALFSIFILGLCFAADVALALAAWQHCTERATNNAE